MSHFTKVKTQIRDLEALTKALTDLGYKFTQKKDTKVKGYAGQTMKADFVIHACQAYDIAVTKAENGAFQFEADWWGIHGQTGVTEGEFIKKVSQRYTYHKLQSELARGRFVLQAEEEASDGTIRMTVRALA